MGGGCHSGVGRNATTVAEVVICRSAEAVVSVWSCVVSKRSSPYGANGIYHFGGMSPPLNIIHTVMQLP